MDDLITLHVFAEDYDAETSWRLVKWCQKSGANEWTMDGTGTEGADAALFDRFNEVVASFRRPSAERRRLSAMRAEDLIRQTDLWTLDFASIHALQEFLPDGPFMYPSYVDVWFEDLTLYRGTEVMLGVVSHECEGVLRVTPGERQDLDRQQFPYHLHGSYVGY